MSNPRDVTMVNEVNTATTAVFVTKSEWKRNARPINKSRDTLTVQVTSTNERKHTFLCFERTKSVVLDMMSWLENDTDFTRCPLEWSLDDGTLPFIARPSGWTRYSMFEKMALHTFMAWNRMQNRIANESEWEIILPISLETTKTSSPMRRGICIVNWTTPSAKLQTLWAKCINDRTEVRFNHQKKGAICVLTSESVAFCDPSRRRRLFHYTSQLWWLLAYNPARRGINTTMPQRSIWCCLCLLEPVHVSNRRASRSLRSSKSS